MNDVLEVTAATFDSEVLKHSLPVLVEFYSPWCASCRKMEPVVERLAVEFGGSIKFVKVNVDDEPELASRHEINAVPTLLLFKGAQVIHEVVGLASLGWIEAVLQKAIETSTKSTEELAVG
ncbi:MAG: thioredoxin [Verrucomicrobia bacterium]|nr:thioredoxin [Verrucomicrobiota bacterium]